MTLEEARQLKPGDRVLVEAVIGLDPHDKRTIDRDGDVWLQKPYVKPEAIREKVAPPRRKFKKGDIVRTHRGYVFFAVEDEDEDGKVGVEHSEELDACHFAEAENLTLLLAVENRKDRKEGEA